MMFECVLAILSSCFATAVMSYVALATPIGPWLESTLVLLATIICRALLPKISQTRYARILGLSTVAGGVGGIVAVACAFSFPTLYFLSPTLFVQWQAQPLFFSAVMAGLVCAAGGLAFIVARIVEYQMLADASLTFPIGALVARMVTAQNQVRKSLELLLGAGSLLIFSGLQVFTKLIPSSITIIPAFLNIPRIALNLQVLPMLWAVGFVTGHVIAMPLLIGVISKLSVLDLLNRYVFSQVASNDFLLAFCTGMVVHGAVLGFLDLPATVVATYHRLRKRKHVQSTSSDMITTLSGLPGEALAKSGIKERFFWLESALVLLGCALFLWLFKFSLLSQLYLVILTVVWMYQVILIAGKTGLAPLGRFATFVMLPGLVLFGYSHEQAVLVATFVEISVGVIADLFFGRKMARILDIDMAQVRRFQWLGLIVSALTVGSIFLILIKQFGLGSSVLLAQRAQTRALLIKAFNFNIGVMIAGALFSMVLKHLRFNAVLVLSGILMPVEYAIPLIAGGLSTKLVKDRENYYPFWSGVFAASSLWMILQGIKGLLH